MLGLSRLPQGHLHCRYPRKCCLAYSFIHFLFSFLFWRLLQVAGEEGKGWVGTDPILVAVGVTILLWQWGQGCWLSVMSSGGIWELRLSINQNFSSALGWRQRL